MAVMEMLVDAAKIMDGDAVSVVGDGGADIMQVTPAVRKTRFKFEPDTDVVLASEVYLSGAHIAGWGKKEQMYAKVLERFLKSRLLEGLDMARTSVPTAKTLMDRMSYLLAERR